MLLQVADILDIHKYLTKKKWDSIKMFRFVEQIFFSAKMLFGCNVSSVNPLKCVSMNNQECKIRREVVNVNGDEPTFYPSSVKISKCSGSCNNINNSFAKLCIPDLVKNINLKLFNSQGLMKQDI